MSTLIHRTAASHRSSLATVVLGSVVIAAAAMSGCDRAAAGVGSTSPRVLRFCAIPDQDETRLREKFAPVAAYLADALGVPVKYQHATSYATAVELFRNGDVQLAWFGGLSGVQARIAVPGARAIAQGATDVEFRSYFIAHADTGLRASEEFPTDIAGRRFTFGSSGSTSGRMMPEYFIRECTGKSPEQLFGHKNDYSGAHDKTCELVQAGTFEVGAVNFKAYDDLVAAGRIDPDVCRKIWESPTYPDYNFTAHPMLEEWFGTGFVERLRQAILAIDDPELLRAFSRSSLIAASNTDYASIRSLAIELGLAR